MHYTRERDDRDGECPECGLVVTIEEGTCPECGLDPVFYHQGLLDDEVESEDDIPTIDTDRLQ